MDRVPEMGASLSVVFSFHKMAEVFHDNAILVFANSVDKPGISRILGFFLSPRIFSISYFSKSLRIPPL